MLYGGYNTFYFAGKAKRPLVFVNSQNWEMSKMLKSRMRQDQGFFTRMLPAAFSLGLIAVSLSAQSAPQVPQGSVKIGPQLPPPIATMLKKGSDAKIIETFKVPGTDITAWVIGAQGERRIFYVPASNTVAILGLVFDENLVNLTEAHAKKAREVPVATASPDQAANHLPRGFFSDATTKMTLGQLAVADAALVEGVGRDVYVIYDPACRFCHQFWRDTRHSLNRVRIHWIPVAKVAKNSAFLADAIIGAVNPSSAMAAASDGRLQPSQVLTQRSQLMLDKNAMILEASGKSNVPYIAFADKGRVYGYLGAPNAEALSVILGKK